MRNNARGGWIGRRVDVCVAILLCVCRAREIEVVMGCCCGGLLSKLILLTQFKFLVGRKK